MAAGRAKLAMTQGLSVWVLEAPDGFGDAQVHAHHAIQITACLAGALRLDCGNETIAGTAIAVAADARHSFAAHGLLAFVFVEPESRAGRALAARLFGQASLAAIAPDALAAALDPLRATFPDKLGSEALLAAGRAALAALVPPEPPAKTDGRIARILEHAGAHLDRSLEACARDVGVYLSPSRLRHLFVEQTGLPFKTYMLWLRMVRALDVYSRGGSLTQAAHEAGFSDSAHFSRIFKRTFGLPATTLARF